MEKIRLTKSILISLLLIASSCPQGIFAQWYGPTGRNTVYWQVKNAGMNTCANDGTIDAPAPMSPDPAGTPNSGSFWVQYFGQSRVNTALFGSSPIFVPCQRWDPIAPVTNSVTYPSGENRDKIIYPVIAGTDSGGAGVYFYELQVRYASDPLVPVWWAWTPVKTSRELNPNYEYIATNGAGLYQFRGRVYDRAENVSTNGTSGWVEGWFYQLLAAGWYGPSGPDTAYTNTVIGVGANNCPEDTQVDAQGPTKEYLGPNYQTSTVGGNQNYSIYNITSVAPNRQARLNTTTTTPAVAWRLSCQRWDAQNPAVTDVVYTDGWRNVTTIPITVTASDLGGAGMWKYIIEMSSSDESPAFTTWSPWSEIYNQVRIGIGSVSYTYNTTLDVPARAGRNRAYRFRARVMDLAANVSTTYAPNRTYKLDTTAPSPANITTSTPSDLLATNAQNFAFTINDTGSDIEMSSRFEDYRNPSNWINALNPSVAGKSFQSTQNIQNIDLQRSALGGRVYTYQITRLQDLAWNRWTGNQNFYYNVYANPVGGVSTPNTSGFVNMVADGRDRSYLTSLRDPYNNIIIPASGINRTVNLRLTNISNTLYFDQYLRSGNTAAMVSTGTNLYYLPFSASMSFDRYPSTTGNYTLKLRAYTATANGYAPGDTVSDPDAALGFTVNYDIIDPAFSNQTYTDASFSPVIIPLFTGSVRGDQKDGGFIEGVVQSGRLFMTRSQYTTRTSWTSPQYQLLFTGSNSPNFLLLGQSATPPTALIDDVPRAMTTNPTSFPVSNYPLYTLLRQNAGTSVATTSNLALASLYQYVLDGYTIRLNGPVIGRAGGLFGSDQAAGTQEGLKVLGPIASQNLQAITDGQFGAGVSIFGWVSRGELRDGIRKSVALATRNMRMQNRSSTLAGVTDIPASAGSIRAGVIALGGDDRIMLLEATAPNTTVTLNAGTPLTLSGRRTLVVRWANLYIRSDLWYGDPKKDILGVVVQKDSLGRGGNLYIDPSITNLVGTYMIDGSVMSYDGTRELDANTPVTTLKNQLHIYGSLVSENTIGGSRMATPQCPSLLNVPGCTTFIVAQKYDLNYLRRYYLNDATRIGWTLGAKTPFGGGKIAGGGWCDIAGICTGFDARLMKKFNRTTEDLAKYPVIIEYNTNILRLRPPGFEDVLE